MFFILVILVLIHLNKNYLHRFHQHTVHQFHIREVHYFPSILSISTGDITAREHSDTAQLECAANGVPQVDQLHSSFSFVFVFLFVFVFWLWQLN